jgi:hypothetical protein
VRAPGIAVISSAVHVSAAALGTVFLPGMAANSPRVHAGPSSVVTWGAEVGGQADLPATGWSAAARSAARGTTLLDTTHEAGVRDLHRAVRRSCHVGLLPIRFPYRIDRDSVCGKVRRPTEPVNGARERSRISDGTPPSAGSALVTWVDISALQARTTRQEGARSPEVQSPQPDSVQPGRTVQLSPHGPSRAERNSALPAPTTGVHLTPRPQGRARPSVAAGPPRTACHVRRRRRRPRTRRGRRRPGAARRAWSCRRRAGPGA